MGRLSRVDWTETSWCWVVFLGGSRALGRKLFVAPNIHHVDTRCHWCPHQSYHRWPQTKICWHNAHWDSGHQTLACDSPTVCQMLAFDSIHNWPRIAIILRYHLNLWLPLSICACVCVRVGGWEILRITEMLWKFSMKSTPYMKVNGFKIMGFGIRSIAIILSIVYLKTRTRLDTVSTHVIELPYYRRYQLDIDGIILYKPDCFNVIWCTLRRCRWFYINFYMLDVMNDLLFVIGLFWVGLGVYLIAVIPWSLPVLSLCDKHSRNPY